MNLRVFCSAIMSVRRTLQIVQCFLAPHILCLPFISLALAVYFSRAYGFWGFLGSALVFGAYARKSYDGSERKQSRRNPACMATA